LLSIKSLLGAALIFRMLAKSWITRSFGLGRRVGAELNIAPPLICSDAAWKSSDNGALRGDKSEKKYSRLLTPESKAKLSEMLKDATQRLIVASVLIATMAFGITFDIPGG
jgi:hypothetical protein